MLVKYVADCQLHLDQAICVTWDQARFLELPAIQKSIDKFELSIDEGLALPIKNGELSHGLYRYISNGELNPVFAATLTPEQKDAMNAYSFHEQIDCGKKTLKEALTLVAKVVSQSAENVI